jgi:hypothetical protein
VFVIDPYSLNTDSDPGILLGYGLLTLTKFVSSKTVYVYYPYKRRSGSSNINFFSFLVCQNPDPLPYRIRIRFGSETLQSCYDHLQKKKEEISMDSFSWGFENPSWWALKKIS